MKKPKASTMLAAAAIALGLSGAGVGVIHAATNTSTNNPMNNLVSAIATKFNLNTTDVQQVFDEQRTQMQAQRQQEYKDYLAQAVTDGKLTQDQADKIIAKQAELESQREANMTAMQSQTQEERKASMEAHKQELDQWATENNIPQEYLRFGFGKGPGHGGRGGHGFGGPAPEQAQQ